MKLSVVVPAFNEEKLLPACLASVRRAAAERGLQVELIVCDNNSTDGTARLARERADQVVFEPVNQIGRARNAGARAASGDWLLFVDADSTLSSGTLGELVDVAAAGGVAGGGCLIGLDEAPLDARLVVASWNVLSRAVGLAAGSFLFCRAEAFRDVGGFSDAFYAGEELDLSVRLKRWARERRLRFVILTRAPHVSSGRKARLYSRLEMLGMLLRAVRRPRSALGDRAALSFFYDGRR